jgi:large subunit ribosomal protein L31
VKKGIHPEYKETTIVCACGNVIHTRSTKENIHVEICSKCHPFYTGKQKLVDSAGMVDRFKKRYAKKKEAEPEAGSEEAAQPPEGKNE